MCHDITPGRSHGFTFAWYRLKVILPETVQGQDIRSGRVLFETCVDDDGEIRINGACDRERGAVQGFNVPQRVVVTTEPQPGQHRLSLYPLATALTASLVGSFCALRGPRPQWAHGILGDSQIRD